VASVKQAAIELIKELPDDCTFEDIQYKLYVRQKIQRSIKAAAEGRVKTHAQVKKRLSKWLVK
jgi:predicted transcriptional regulator